MQSPGRSALFFALLTFACLAGSLPAGATSYVMMDDGDLADGAPLIVDGRIEAAARAVDAPEAATEYTVAVIRTVKGSAPATLAVRVLGGLPRDDGPWFHAWGVPRFQPGERVLLFLSPRDDGRFGLFQLALGAFRGVPDVGRHLAVRPELVSFAVAGGEERARDFDAFVDWLAARARGESRPADYFLAAPAGGLGRIAERYNLFEAQGMNFRWAEFDYDVKVDFRANEAGQSGMSGGGFGEVETGMWAWNLDPHSNVQLRYRGTTGYAGRWSQCDGVNLVLFDDPHAEIDGTFNCQGGGVLAIGGVCSRGTHSFQGRSYWAISEGDILTQDGAGCRYGVAGGKYAAYVFGHEFGHTLGFAHSCGPGTSDPNCSNPASADAIMRGGGSSRALQGVRLGDDDRAALAALYPLNDGGGGGGGGGGGNVDPDGWLTSDEVPGFRFRVEIQPGGGAEPIQGRREDRCLAETLCVSGALPGRVEVECRVIGPRPNGKLWPTFVKFTVSRVEVEVEQIATGETRMYTLEGAGPGEDVLNGLFDREGFDP